MDTKSDFDRILNTHGAYVVLMRHIKPIKCLCYSPLHNEPSPSCQICLGTGYPIELERHKARSTDFRANFRVLSSMPMGSTGIPSKVFYFKAEVLVTESNIIAEASWQGLTPTILSAYTVEYVNHQFGKLGEHIFNAAVVNMDPEAARRLSLSTFGQLRVVDL